MRLIVALIVLAPLGGTAQTVNPAFLVNEKPPVHIIKPANEGLFAFGQGGLYGYVDRNMKVVIPAEFEFDKRADEPATAAVFVKGHAVVKKDYKWFLIDKTGKRLSPPFPERIIDYDLGTGLFVLESDFMAFKTLVDAAGTKITHGTHNNLILDSNRVVTVHKHPLTKEVMYVYNLLDATGKPVLPNHDELLNHFHNIAFYRSEGIVMATDPFYNLIYDLNGKVLLKLPRNHSTTIKQELTPGMASGYFTKDPNRQMHFHSVSKGRIIFKDKEGRDGKFGMLDLQGNLVMEPRYDAIGEGFDKYGMCKVSKKGTGTMWYMDAYIDRNGKEVLPLVDGSYDFQHDLPAGLAMDPKTKLYGVIDRKGKWVVPPTYLKVSNMDRFGGFQANLPSDAKFSYIDLTGKNHGKITPSGALVRYDPTGDGYFLAEVPDSSIRMADRNGSLSQPITGVQAYGEFSEGLAPILCAGSGKYGFIDQTGKVVIPCEYDNVMPFKGGATRAIKIVQGKPMGGYIDRQGRVILPIQYESIGAFKDGQGIVASNTGFSYVDGTGRIKTPPTEFGEQFSEFSSGLGMGVRPKPDGMKTFTYFDKDLKKVLSIDAYNAGYFNGNMAIAYLMPGEISIIDRKGVKVKAIPLQGLQNLQPAGAGKLAVKYNGKWGFMNEKGEMIVQPKYDSVSSFVGFYAPALRGGKWGIIDEKDKTVIDFKYETIKLGEDKLVTYMLKAGSWGVMTVTGEQLFQSPLKMASTFNEGKGIVSTGSRQILMRSPLAK